MSRAARNSLKLSFFTIISRVMGLMRDHFQAVFFGTGAIATAWEISFMLPNMLRNLLAEGVLSQSFIPIYSESLRESEQAGRKAAGVLLGFLFFVLLAVVAGGILLFPVILPIMTGKSPEEARLMIDLSQTMFVFIMTASLTAILSGIANTHNHFSVPALSPILLNLVFISGFLILIPFHFDASTNARYLAISVVVGGFLQMGLQAVHIAMQGWTPHLTLRLRDPVIIKVFSLMAPAVLGASLFQLNQLMDIAIASYLIPESVGAVPALRYAHRLIQLPTGIIGVALSTAILPALVYSIRQNRSEQNGGELAHALTFSLFLTMPSGLGLYILGPEILNLLFYGGAWNEHSTAVTWAALQFYTLGVPFFSANKILTSSFYAYQDTRTPVKIMLRIILINFVLNLALVHFLQQGGLALSTAIAAVVNTVYLLVLLRKKVGDIPWREVYYSVRKQGILWAGLALYLILIHTLLAPFLDMGGLRFTAMLHLGNVPRYTAMMHVLAGVVGGAVIYFGLAVALKIQEMEVILVTLRIKKPAS